MEEAEEPAESGNEVTEPSITEVPDGNRLQKLNLKRRKVNAMIGRQTERSDIKGAGRMPWQ